jgi:hypothetical protein
MTEGGFTLYDFLMWLQLVTVVAFAVCGWILVYRLTARFLNWLSQSSPFIPEKIFKGKRNQTKDARKSSDKSDNPKNLKSYRFGYIEIIKHILRTTSLDKEEKHPIKNCGGDRDLNNNPDNRKGASHIE